ncbi:MAG: hypothetical protein WC529_01205 [Candidatus Margulisiibacteriota bacterium]
MGVTTVGPARTAGPTRPVNNFERITRRKQEQFNRLPLSGFRDPSVKGLVREIVEGRKQAAAEYAAGNDFLNAGFQLGHASSAVEIFAKYFLVQERTGDPLPVSQPEAVTLLQEALALRTASLQQFQRLKRSTLQIAYALSYRANALSFLRKNAPGFDTLANLEEVIENKERAYRLFSDKREMRGATFELDNLVSLYFEKGERFDAECYLKAAERALAMYELIKDALAALPRAVSPLKRAVSAYRRYARQVSDPEKRTSYSQLADRLEKGIKAPASAR